MSLAKTVERLPPRMLRRPSREDGQALVEFAILLPLLLLILVGSMKFGLTLNNYLTLTDAARVGARQLALSRGLTTNPCAAAEQRATVAAGGLSSSQITYSESFSPGTDNCTNSATTWNEGDTATFTASYPCDLTILGVSFFSGCRLSASASEAVE